MKKKSYKNGGGSKAAVFFKKNLGYFLLILSLLVIAAVVTTVLVLTQNQDSPPIETPVDSTPIVYAMPVQNYTEIEESSLDQLVYSQTLKKWMTHNGVDFACEKGETVSAIMDGKVKSVVTTALYGTVVTIEHDDGLVSIYKSLDENVLVEIDAIVTKGQPIGTVSDTNLSEMHNGAHLHLEMKKDGLFVNPADYIDELAGK